MLDEFVADVRGGRGREGGPLDAVALAHEAGDQEEEGGVQRRQPGFPCGGRRDVGDDDRDDCEVCAFNSQFNNSGF